MRQNNKHNKIKPRDIYISSLETKKKGSVSSYIFQFFLLYIGLIGFLYSVSTSVDMCINLPVIMIIAFPCLLISSLFALNKKLFIPYLCVFSSVILFIIFFLRNVLTYIVDAFTYCYNLTIHIVVEEGYANYASYMTEDISEIISDATLTNGYFYCVIIVLAIVFSIIFAATLMKKSFVWLSVLPCFVVLTPSLYFGAVPDGNAFAIFLSGIIGCYVENIAYWLYNNNKHNSTLKNSMGYLINCSVNGFVIACTVMVISLSVSNIVYSKEVLQLDVIREIIDETAMKFMNKLFYKQYETAEGAVGGLLDGEVLELNPPSFRNLPIMTVTTNTGTSLYLRGWIGKDAVDNGWVVLNDNDTDLFFSKVGPNFNPYTQLYDYTNIVSTTEFSGDEDRKTTDKFGFVFDTVKVKSKFNKSLMMFVPVSGIDDKVIGRYRGITIIGDTIYFFKERRPTGNTYTIKAALQSFSNREFYLNFKENQNSYLQLAGFLSDKTNFNEEEQFMHDERLYADYVRNTYLALPENTEYLEELALDITNNYLSEFDKALAIERYFKNEYTYAKNFAVTGGTIVDKVKYMINNSKTGYCTYFATAMTLMLRELNIPSRFVIGYHAMTQADSEGDKYIREIYDNNYHAWVEVYFDGVGWLTFDPTPGVNGSNVIRDYDYLDDPIEDSTNDSPETPEQLPQEQLPKEDEFEGGIGNEMPIPDNSLPKWSIILIVVFGFLFIITAVVAITVVSITQKFNDYYNSLIYLDPTEMTRIVYPQILRLFGALGYKPRPGELLNEFAERIDDNFKLSVSFSSIIDALEMSQFSKNEIDIKSAERINEYFNKLSDTVFYSINIFKKYYYMATIKKK